jgi:hypothetical protein
MGGSNWQFGPRNTDGWALMTPAERAAHRTKMLGLTSYDECVAYTAQHHAQMQARAAEKGVATRPQPRQNMCERMKSAGRLK